MAKSIDKKALAKALRADVEKAMPVGKQLTIRTLLSKFGYKKRTDNNTDEITYLLFNVGLIIDPSIIRSGKVWETTLDDLIYLSADTFDRYNIKYLYHMTHIDNLPSIFKYGLLSHNEAHRRKLVSNDISAKGVQKRRSRMKIGDRYLHDFACLYFSSRNPMLFRLREAQHKLVFIGVDPTVLCLKETKFSDGNAASDSTKVYEGTFYLSQLPWNIINAADWKKHDDGKRIKCAEILVYPKVELKYIKKIFCFSKDQIKRLGQLVPTGVKISVEKNSDLYFEPNKLMSMEECLKHIRDKSKIT